MAYQYQQTITNSIYGAASGADALRAQAADSDAAAQTIPDAVGQILTGTVLQGGNSPVVDLGGSAVQVRSDALQNAQAGDRVYLQITDRSSSEITMKLVDPSALAGSAGGVRQTEILKNTARFAEDWLQEHQEQTETSGVLSEEADSLLSSMSAEEKTRLRQMGLEVTSSNLTAIRGLLTQFRGDEQKQQLQDAIESVQKQIQLSSPQEAGTSDPVILTLQEGAVPLSQIMNEANQSLPISDEQTAYLIQNQQALSLDNLYHAAYSARSGSAVQPVSEEAFQQMLPQIQRAIQTAGMETNEASLDTARFLLDRQLPVTTDSLKTYAAIADVNESGFSESNVLQQLTEAVARQQETGAADRRISYRQTELYFPTPSIVADQIKEDLQQITDTGLEAFAQSGLPYTLENLSAFFRSQAQTETQVSEESVSGSTPDSRAETLTAYRQLEELRLKMTWEAGYRLASEDIHIRARELNDVVERLRQTEWSEQESMLSAQSAALPADQQKLLADTVQTVQDLPYLPASALGAACSSDSLTLERLHRQGVQDLQTLAASDSSGVSRRIAEYETLMTQPRADMGDSIRKAFRNTDAILEDLNLPVTQDNERAVRILGYNQMELSTENIVQVRAADQQVQNLLQTMQPAVVLKLVQDGVNPLNMPVEELNTLAQSYLTEDGLASEESYSEFLLKLERREGISAEERKSYIGIYRLLDKVAKSGEKDLGTLMRNGQTLTLQNLLTAHRSNRAAGIDETADDTYRETTPAAPDTAIDRQILSYQRHLAELLLTNLSPDTIDSMVTEAANGTTLEDFFDTIQRQLTGDPTDGGGASADTGAAEPTAAEQLLADDALRTPEALIQEAFLDSGATSRFLTQFQIFPSLTNAAVASDLRHGGRRTLNTLTDLLSSAGTDQPEDAEKIREQLTGLPEHLSSPEDMADAYAELESSVTATVHAQDETGKITARDIQALKQIRSGLQIMQKMSRQEQFAIPFLIDGEWNLMNLSIIQDSDQPGQIQAEIPTAESGRITANFTWETGRWSGTLSADHADGERLLERNQPNISSLLDTLSDSYTEDTPTTEELYHTARLLVTTLRQMSWTTEAV